MQIFSGSQLSKWPSEEEPLNSMLDVYCGILGIMSGIRTDEGPWLTRNEFSPGPSK